MLLRSSGFKTFDLLIWVSNMAFASDPLPTDFKMLLVQLETLLCEESYDYEQMKYLHLLAIIPKVWNKVAHVLEKPTMSIASLKYSLVSLMEESSICLGWTLYLSCSERPVMWYALHLAYFLMINFILALFRRIFSNLGMPNVEGRRNGTPSGRPST